MTSPFDSPTSGEFLLFNYYNFYKILMVVSVEMDAQTISVWRETAVQRDISTKQTARSIGFHNSRRLTISTVPTIGGPMSMVRIGLSHQSSETSNQIF